MNRFPFNKTFFGHTTKVIGGFKPMESIIKLFVNISENSNEKYPDMYQAMASGHNKSSKKS